jgi:hypothetical protein
VELVKNEVMIRALARLDHAQLERLSAAAADMGAAVEAEMATDSEPFGDLRPHTHAHTHSHGHSRAAHPAP